MKKLLMVAAAIVLTASFAVSMAACATLGERVKLVPVDLTDENYGFCMKQGDTEFLNEVNGLIAQLNGEGIDGVTVQSLFDAEANDTAENIGEVRTSLPSNLSDEERKEYLVVATNSGFEPFEYKEGAYFAGVDMHIAKIFAEEMDRELVILDMAFDSIVATVQTGRADIGMAGMTITEEKEENVQFSDPYFEAHQQIAVLESDTTFDDCTTKEEVEEILATLEGKRVQAAAGYTGYDYIEPFDNLKLTAQEDIGTSIRELSQGNTDIVVGDSFTIAAKVKAINAEIGDSEE